MLWRRRHFEEGSVNAVPDAEFVRERLEVDVGSLVFDGLLKDDIDESYDWCVIGGTFQGGHVIYIDFPVLMDSLQFIENAFDGVVCFWVDHIHQFIDFRRVSDEDPAFSVQGEWEFVNELVVQRISGGDNEGIAFFRDGDDIVEAGRIRSNLGQDFLVSFLLWKE